MFALGAVVGAQQSAPFDGVFARWNGSSTPGCVAGLAEGARAPDIRAFGMADLEHAEPIRVDTVFEAGSISKQFTAAAVLLLVADGRIGLDDPMRRYLPELPDYGAPLTIRHALSHTSGLRDWGAVVAIAGAPRWTRVYTQADVLRTAARQTALNFRPGTQWSYTNTGYNLLAIVVSRVSGMTFEAFTKKRLFEPLGMTHTSWDADHTRVVPRRAIAYSQQADGFHTFMPMEDVLGNRGLLTTVGDLLIWNRHLDAPPTDLQQTVASMEQPGHLEDGRAHGYGFGLFVGRYRGFSEIGHDGGTAGYRADLVRLPDRHLSVAVLCNVERADATSYAHQLLDSALGEVSPRSSPPVTTAAPTELERRRLVAMYQNVGSGRALAVVGDEERLIMVYGGSRIPLVALSSTRFAVGDGATLTFLDNGGAVLADNIGVLTEMYMRTDASVMAAADLRRFEGRFHSNDADATIDVVADGNALYLRRSSGERIALTPAYANAFTAGDFGTVIFRRGGQRIDAFSVVQDRVWDLRFARVTAP